MLKGLIEYHEAGVLRTEYGDSGLEYQFAQAWDVCGGGSGTRCRCSGRKRFQADLALGGWKLLCELFWNSVVSGGENLPLV